MGTVNVKKLDKIRDNYPSTWEWIRAKAKWEAMCTGAVLSNYEDFIDELMRKEDMCIKYEF